MGQIDIYYLNHDTLTPCIRRLSDYKNKTYVCRHNGTIVSMSFTSRTYFIIKNIILLGKKNQCSQALLWWPWNVLSWIDCELHFTYFSILFILDGEDHRAFSWAMWRTSMKQKLPVAPTTHHFSAG